jgi:hypothetical protein
MREVVLQRPICAVKLAEDVQLHGTLHSIPAQARLTILDSSKTPDMVVQWRGQTFAVF